MSSPSLQNAVERDANNETLPGRAECLERPDILRVFPAQDVSVRRSPGAHENKWRLASTSVFHFRDVPAFARQSPVLSGARRLCIRNSIPRARCLVTR